MAGLAVKEALAQLRVGTLVLISPYAKATNEHEIEFLGCTATSMIDAVEDVERRLDKPVVNSNQAVLWAALRRLEITEPTEGLGRLFSAEPTA